MEEPDPQIVAAARSGDLDAFATLIRRYQPDVLRFIGHLARDPTNAEDIAQETFVRLSLVAPIQGRVALHHLAVLDRTQLCDRRSATRGSPSQARAPHRRTGRRGDG